MIVIIVFRTPRRFENIYLLVGFGTIQICRFSDLNRPVNRFFDIPGKKIGSKRIKETITRRMRGLTGLYAEFGEIG